MLPALLQRLTDPTTLSADVIPWGSPVPSFGDASRSTVATLGLNPSNREFVDVAGKELDGPNRRFHTLKSLGLKRWSDATEQHLALMMEACRSYFERNPYDTWFKRLDWIISDTQASYYDSFFCACHLDLIPFATSRKWTELSSQQRSALFSISQDTLGLLLQDSPIKVLVLNGQSVVDHFQRMASVTLKKRRMSEWKLPRQNGEGVDGIAYWGKMSVFDVEPLRREILVLGYNHNIQSSFGVTKKVTAAITRWIGRKTVEVTA